MYQCGVLGTVYTIYHVIRVTSNDDFLEHIMHTYHGKDEVIEISLPQNARHTRTEQ